MELTITLIIFLALSFTINIIQYRRQLQLEKAIETIQFDERSYYTFFEKLFIGINHAFQNLEKLDKRGAFKADDEVGNQNS